MPSKPHLPESPHGGKTGYPLDPRLEPALLKLHQAMDLDSLWKAIVELVGSAMPNQHLVAALPFEGTAPMAMKTTVPHADLEAFWLKLHASEPPLFRMLEKHPGMPLADIDMQLSEEELMETRFYREVMVPDGWRHTVGMLFWEGMALGGHVGICRTEQQGRFSTEEKSLLLTLHPHIHAALRRVAVIARHEFVSGLLREALEHPADGVALVDSNGRLVFQNHAAGIVCAVWHRGRTAAAEILPADKMEELPRPVIDASMRLLAKFLNDYRSDPMKGRKYEQEIPHPAGEAVSARVRVIQPKRRPVAPHVRIEFSRLPKESREALPVYRLSEAEHRVALLVASGMKNQEAAAELGLSVNTVRAHLREVFSKLGVRHRGELHRALRDAASSGMADGHS